MTESIKTIPADSCLLCSRKGQVVYSGLVDVLFGARGTWGIYRCARCSLYWLNPRPQEDEVASLYTNYYTHEGLTNEFLFSNDTTFASFPRNKKIKYAVLDAWFGYRLGLSKKYKLFGIFLGLLPSFRKKVESSIGGFPYKKNARLLDIGCGNGDYLLEMKYLGFDVEGIEIDPHAAEIARNNNLSVVTGVLTDDLYEHNSFDAIYMNNVIEHLANPEEVVAQCHRLLKSGGRLCIKTCSGESLAHSFFKESYRGLEIPRHFFIFSPQSLRILGSNAGFSVKKSYTTFNGYIWAASRAIRRGEKDAAYATESRIALLFQKVIVSVVIFFFPHKGDDIFLLFEK